MVARDLRKGLTRLELVLLAVFCLPLFVGLGRTELENDEAIYSYAAESILATGDWMSPRSSPNEYIPFLEKPPLKFWIVALPIRLGLLPLDEFGLRFWDAVFGSIAFVYVFLLGRRLAGPICGAVALLVLFAHGPLLFHHGLRSNNMEAALVLAYAGGVYHYLAWASAVAPRGRTLHVAAVAGLFYLGFMTKFVAALFLPAIAVLAGLLLPAHRRRLREDWPRWLIAAAAVAAAVAPWFLYQTRYTVEGRDVWSIMFGDHVYTRFTEYADPQHLAPWHFYLSTGWRELSRAGSAIWVAFGLLVLVVHTIRRRLPEGMVILCWLVLPVTLISFGTSKLYHYAYPYLPPLALAAGYGVAWLAGLLATTMRNVAGPGLLKPSRWRHPAFLPLAYGAAALALVTAIQPIEIEVAGREVFRNRSVLRPAVAAIGLAWLAGRTPLALGGGLVLVISLLVPTPFEGAGASLGRLLESRAPLKALGQCLREVEATRRARGAVVAEPYAPVSAEAFLHPYFYYLRGSGWHWPVDDAVLHRALFEPGHDRPVIIDLPRYNAFVERVRPAGPHPPAVSRPGLVVFLPGDYADCRFPPALRPH